MTMNRPKRPNIVIQGKNLGRFIFNFEFIQTFQPKLILCDMADNLWSASLSNIMLDKNRFDRLTEG